VELRRARPAEVEFGLGYGCRYCYRGSGSGGFVVLNVIVVVGK
jgi:hypothetical protein